MLFRGEIRICFEKIIKNQITSTKALLPVPDTHNVLVAECSLLAGIHVQVSRACLFCCEFSLYMLAACLYNLLILAAELMQR